MGVTFASPADLLAVVAPLGEDPDRVAVLFDLDGTLAPIVDRPGDTSVPLRTRELVGRIAQRYGLCGVVSGRQALEARRILDLPELTYIGNHGFELLRPGAAEPEPAPALKGMEGDAARFAAELDPGRLAGTGLRTEDKAAIVALHWRGAPDPDAAEAAAARIGEEAEAAGLHTHRGRMVLELRPAVEIDKGIGLRALLEAESGIESAFYAGDDRTDADGFRALAEMAETGDLERAVRVAVVSPETPDEVPEAADIAVAGPEGFVPVLEALA
jgi:trehalose 6-phosphate phosphatase